MLDNGCLTYPGANSLFRNWQPATPFVRELLFATVTTCFVYQLTKLCLDLGLGQRRRGAIRISDLYILIIVSNFSLRSLVSAFGCEGFLARKRFHGEEKLCSQESPMRGDIGYPVLMKLAVLLIVGPAIHMIGIYLSLERDKTVTFRDSGFGGAALGLNNNGPVIDKSSGFFCPRICSKFARGEVALTQFSRCYQAGSFPFQNDLQPDKLILILRSTALDIGVTLVTPGRRWISILFLDIHTGEKPHRLRNILSEQQKHEIFERGLQEMTRSCTPEIQRGVNISFIIPPSPPDLPRQQIISAEVRCDGFKTEDLESIADSLLNGVTITDTEKMEISSELKETFTSGEDIDLLLRRTNNASFFSILLATVIAFVIKLTIKFMLFNDGHLAVETIVKDGLNMKCCDSILQSKNTVYYEHEIEVENQDGFIETNEKGLQKPQGLQRSEASESLRDLPLSPKPG